MKKFISSFLIFGAFTMAFYITLLFVWGQYAPPFLKPNIAYIIGAKGHMYSRINEVQQVQNVDILFLGSSHAYRGFDSRIFTRAGYSSFNLGSSSQTPIQTHILLDRYLKKIHPKLIIYEVYPEVFCIDGVESSLDLISNDKNDIHSAKMVLELNHPKVYNTYLFALVNELFNINEGFKEPKVKHNDTYISGGYVERKMSHYIKEASKSDEWKFKKKQLTRFDIVVEGINRKNIPIVFVNAPIVPSLYHSYSNNDEFDQLISGKGKYLNFNNLLALDDSLHFYDHHHLNQSGVAIFNKRLIEILENDGSLSGIK